MPKAPVHLITGFLGSGKTTLIKRLLDNYALNKKLAVIQNEFAAHNIDGKELRQTTTRHFDLLEVNNGSVFCVCLLSGFRQSFIKFYDEYQPELVLFEASGLSDPVSVGEIFNDPEFQERVYLANTICIVDASSFMAVEKLQQRIVHQVQIANIVILNKIDQSENLDLILEKVNRLNPQSKKSIAEYCNVNLNELFDEQDADNRPENKKFFVRLNDSGRPDILSGVFKSTKTIKEAFYTRFLKEIAENMVRIKGYLVLDSGKTIGVQFSGSGLETTEVERKTNQTEIIAIGYKLGPSDLRKIYEQYC